MLKMMYRNSSVIQGQAGVCRD